MNNNYFNTYLILITLLILQACAIAVVTSGVAGGSMAHDRRTTGTVIEDQAIELKVNQAFYHDEEINKQSHWNVTSYNTIVLITGEVPNEELRRKMIDIAQEIEKVSLVHDEMTIAAPSSLLSRSSDTLVTSKVKTKLLTDKNVDGLRVKVVTENGVVYLMGLMSEEEAERVTEITRQTGGVQKVVKLFQYTDIN